MSVWLVLPSKRPAEEAEKYLSLWRKQGYKIAVQRDSSEADPISLGGGNVAIMEQKVWANGDWFFFREYKGYAEAVNFIVSHVLAFNPDCDWIVAAGDDTEPDLNHTADEIAAQLTAHFGGTFGVCQPTGDRWSDAQGVLVERVAGSPWMGREWCLRANQGKGPLWPEFFHMFADECLQETAKKLGVFWQRPDLIHLHKHWGRPKDGETMGQASNMPDFLVKANSPAEWRKSKAEFERLRAGGFAECLPL